jgi:hypothetical protein
VTSIGFNPKVTGIAALGYPETVVTPATVMRALGLCAVAVIVGGAPVESSAGMMAEAVYASVAGANVGEIAPVEIVSTESFAFVEGQWTATFVTSAPAMRPN